MTWSRTSRQARGYGAEHDRMRQHLIETVVLCEECTRQGKVVVGTVADHIKPLSDGGTSDRSNYQLLCGDCSDAKTIVDRGAKPKPVKRGSDANGWPTDPRHPWNVAKGGG